MTLSHSYPVSKRSAFTIIELLVSIAVIGLLCALVFPAIQAARESARRATCKNNLHQIGIALESRAEILGHFPDAQNLFPELLPSLGQSAIYDNVRNGVYDNGSAPRPGFPTYRCPSDPITPFADMLSYAANYGTGNQVHGQDGFFVSIEDAGAVGWPGVSASTLSLTRHQDITDGLSQTVAISEILPTSIEAYGQPGSRISDYRRVFWVISPSLHRPNEFSQFREQCAAFRTPPGGANFASATRGWFWSSSAHNSSLALYHHIMPPNFPSCFNSGPTYGAFTAGSLHSGGIHALFGDGRVEFLSDSIDTKVWRDNGTRSGS